MSKGAILTSVPVLPPLDVLSEHASDMPETGSMVVRETSWTDTTSILRRKRERPTWPHSFAQYAVGICCRCDAAAIERTVYQLFPTKRAPPHHQPAAPRRCSLESLPFSSRTTCFHGRCGLLVYLLTKRPPRMPPRPLPYSPSAHHYCHLGLCPTHQAPTTPATSTTAGAPDASAGCA